MATLFAPGSELNIVHEFVWRVEFYAAKATGRIPQLSWSEVIQGTWPGQRLHDSWPGSDFITDKWAAEGRSLNATITNPLVDPQSVEQGKALFQVNCAPCHGNHGSGSERAPSLAKKNYSVGTSDFALYQTLRDGIPGTAMPSLDLSVEQRWQLISYVRTLSGGPDVDTTATSALASINVSWDMVRTARERPDEWLTYSGTLEGHRHSTLSEITAANVSGLKLRWVHQFKTTVEESFEATPIVAGKTIFMTQPPATVVAINAETGLEVWSHTRSLPDELPICCGQVNRGLAVLGDTLFWGTLDGNLVALDAANGNEKWSTQVVSPKDGFTITVAPLVVQNLVVIGVSGGEFGVRGFLAAYDTVTGKQAWQFHTIPAPGEFGSDTWTNDAWKTGGGPTWVTGSYDPELNLLYWGVGNPAPNYASGARPGDNLFTNSVVALDATTGKLAWYFQFTPHDAHDWDSNQTPLLADMKIDGVERKTICWANRNGFYYVLDRTNGKFIKGAPFVKVTWATGLDPQGRAIETENAKVTPAGVLTSPPVEGGVNWPPSSYDPRTQTVFVNATEGASIYTSTADDEVKRGEGGLYVGSGSSSEEASVKFVKAIDATTGNIKWEHKSPRQNAAPDETYSGVLSTDGGVVFSAYAGMFFALDSESGKELWRAGLGGKTHAPPISFTLDGKQVVAVTAGGTLFLFGL